MGDGLAFFDILIFAVIAAVLLLRLRNVLGRRTGHEEHRPNPFTQRDADRRNGRGDDNVVPLPARGFGGGDEDGEEEEALQASGLGAVRALDPRFDEAGFVRGAKIAFGMIVEAYAQGDIDTLRPLLSDDLYDGFSEAIQRRADDGESLETRIESLYAEVDDARTEGREVFITVRFESRQINITRNEAGAVIEGDPTSPAEVVDLWTFMRDTRSGDPNWTLVATGTPG